MARASNKYAATVRKMRIREVSSEGVTDVDEQSEVLEVRSPIASYGADYPVDGLVKRLIDGSIKIPTFDPANDKGGLRGFQRKYVWTPRQADRFIESLLLGFPVPGIFLVKQPDNVHLVLDGAQRLETLRHFYEGTLRGSEFALEDVQAQWVGKTYRTLDPADRRRLDDSILHATVIRQEDAGSDVNAVYMIFERLNTGGTLLQPQEIRVALFHGAFVEHLRSLNNDQAWRQLFGKKSPHLKDQELILRAFAMLDRSKAYTRPMKEFLNDYLRENRNLKVRSAGGLEPLFGRSCELILKHIGPKAFRLKNSINAAVAESVMYGVMRNLEENTLCDAQDLASRFASLLARSEYLASVTKATADESSVRLRLDFAHGAFAR